MAPRIFLRSAAVLVMVMSARPNISFASCPVKGTRTVVLPRANHCRMALALEYVEYQWDMEYGYNLIAWGYNGYELGNLWL